MQAAPGAILMTWSKLLGLWCRRLLGFSIVLVTLAGCGGGSDGDKGPPGPQGPPGPPGASPTATELNITVDSVTIASPPVVEFTVTNEDGIGFPGLTGSDLRFNIAKLIPGFPTQWQNYIVRVRDGAVQGTQERNLQCPDPNTGGQKDCLDDHGDGTYTYTFATDITNVPCPAPCTDADGNPLNLSYQPGQTHRLSIQQGNRDLPLANAVFDFVPAGGPVTSMREIVKTANCNECHDKITAHGSRFEMRLCVTCHNPGSWIKNADSTTTTVDFKVMIHKIHRGEDLPSGSYAVGSHDFSDIVFPQDIRNCTKCHDGDDPDTPQGNNWQLVPSMEACGSCHEDIDFSKDGSGTPPHEPGGHSGGVVTSNSECTICHKDGGLAGSVAESHTVPGKAERAFFQFNILTICGKPVDQDPMCAEGSSPTVTFSVEDPSGNGGHQNGDFYNIDQASTSDPEYATATAGTNARLTMDFAWKGVDENDYTNDANPGDVAGDRPSRALQVDLLSQYGKGVSYLGNGEYLYDAANDSTPWTIPVLASPHTPIGTVGVAIEGRGAAYSVADCGKVPPADLTGCYKTRVPVKAPVASFAVNDTSPQPRRQVVDATTKCDRCHDVLSLHGGSRNDNGQMCVFCHNPSNTDVSRRPKDGVTGLPTISPVDGKTEESIDFKRLIHGIHAASITNFDGTDAHGFRDKGLVIYGFSGSPNDFSKVRFPGVLSKCETCHLEAGDLNGAAKYDTYILEDHTGVSNDALHGANWELPAQSGIIGSTVNSYPNAAADGSDFDAKLADQQDDLKFSPIASVCSACHDGALETAHMQDNGGVVGLLDTDATSSTFGQTDGETQMFLKNNVESCPVCHGPGKLADVELVHDQAFADFLGEFIP